MSDNSAAIAELQGMGFDPAACALALQLHENSLHRAIDHLLSMPEAQSGGVLPASDEQQSSSRERSPPPPRLSPASVHRPPPVGDERPIFSMGFDAEQVRLALRRTGDNETRAIELLLSGPVPPADGPRPGRPFETPTDWPGTPEEFNDAMRSTMELYMQW
jgi:hypothetical protein